MTRRRILWSGVAIGALAAIGIGLATMTVTTRQGINYRVSIKPIPFYVKALDFLHRDAHYRLLADEITRGVAEEDARIEALLDWTRRAVRPTPPDWPVVDDHVLNIVIRGHGKSDQIADVFTTLATYAGHPAFCRATEHPCNIRGPVISFVKVRGAWRVIDVERGIVFRNARGEWATLDELLNDDALVRQQTGALLVRGIPYEQHLAILRSAGVPTPLRAALQMPGPRAAYELLRTLQPGNFLPPYKLKSSTKGRVTEEPA